MKKSCFRRKGAGSPLCSHQREDKRIRYPLLVLAGLISTHPFRQAIRYSSSTLGCQRFPSHWGLTLFSFVPCLWHKRYNTFLKNLEAVISFSLLHSFFSIVTQHSSPQTLRDDTKNSCVADYISLQAKKTTSCSPKLMHTLFQVLKTLSSLCKILSRQQDVLSAIWKWWIRWMENWVK